MAKFKVFNLCVSDLKTENRQCVFIDHIPHTDEKIAHTDILGRVSREKDGGWSCYYGYNTWIGKEPNLDWALKFVEKYLKHFHPKWFE